MSPAALLERNSSPSDFEIVQAMNGNLCRCGSCPRVLTAIRLGAESA